MITLCDMENHAEQEDGSSKVLLSLEECEETLLARNSKLFMTTMQYREMEHVGDRALYEKEGFDANMPLPVSAGSETLKELNRLVEELAVLTGVEFEDLERQKSLDLLHSSWFVRGRYVDSHELNFAAKFSVHESLGKISDLKLHSNNSPIKLELPKLFALCERKSCFRTFCTIFAEYGEFFVRRGQMFQRLSEKFPEKVFISHAVPYHVPHQEGFVVTSLRILNGSKEAYFILRPTLEEEEKDANMLTTKIRLFRRDKSSQTPASFELDADFEYLVKLQGLEKGLEIFISNFLS